MSIEKRLLKLLRDEIKNYGLTSHIRYSLEDESNKLNVTVEEFDNFMNGGNDDTSKCSINER